MYAIRSYYVAMTVMFMMSIMKGNIMAKIRFTFTEVTIRSALASAKRSRSVGPRLKARITRMPVRFSRTIRLILV